MFEILIIIVVLLLVFGASKVKSAGSDLGAAVKGFRKGLKQPEAPRPTEPTATQPDAEFPETLAARAPGSDKPRA